MESIFSLMRKLNFGCGSIQPEGWDNIDMEDFGQSLVGGFELLPDNEYDIIVAHCALQINGYNEYDEMLQGFLRILKPGGVLRISLPDILEGFYQYQEGNMRWFPNKERTIDERFSNWLTWYSTSKSLLTPGALKRKLKENDFKPSYQLGFKQTEQENKEIIELDDRENECYFMEATK